MIGQLPDAIIGQIIELDHPQKHAYIQASVQPAISAFKDFVDRMNAIRREEYTEPIERAISVMPLPELATVAEVVVNLSQIRQRMFLERQKRLEGL
jgi:hypothetical protein